MQWLSPAMPQLAGCASGAWLDTFPGKMYEIWATPRRVVSDHDPGPPYVVTGPAGTDLAALARQHRHDITEAGLLFIPTELLPNTGMLLTPEDLDTDG